MEVIANSELRNLRLRNDHSLFTTILGVLGLNVAKCSRDRESSGDHAMRTKDDLLLHLLCSWNSHLMNRLGLIYSATILVDARDFIVFVGAMISR